MGIIGEYCEGCMGGETFEVSWCENCPHNDRYCEYECRSCEVSSICEHNLLRNSTKQEEEKMGEKFWMVCGPGNNPKFRHPTKLSAEQEAERLAKLYPSDQFFVLEAVSVAQQVSSLLRKL